MRNLSADLVLLNADFVTMDRRRPTADAVAVKDGTIVMVGSESEISRIVGKNTLIVDLHGRTVVPGLIDAHAHMLALVNPLPWLDLRDVASIAEIQRRLREKVEETGKGKWILGRGWDQEKLEEKRYPTRWDLDEVSPDNPVLLSRVCGHVGVANSRALKVSKIDKNATLSRSDLVARDSETREPTGVLFEEARDLLWNLPEPSQHDLLRACASACAQAAGYGLTGVHWFAYKPEEVRALQQLHKLGELPIRINLVVHVDDFDEFAAGAIEGESLRLKCIKILTDGSLGARTAALEESYSDEPSTRGTLNYSLEKLKRMVEKIDRAGFQVSVHAIGDLAVDETLKAFEALGSRAVKEKRHRVEHASVLNPTLIRRVAKLELLACVQPHFVVSDSWLRDRLGEERARWAYPFKSLMMANVLLAGSSDAPAEPINPLLGIWAAVTRKSFPQERISVEEALRAYTINAAYFSFEESLKGSIEIGKLADFTVLSENPLKIEPDRIKDVRVEMTVVGGKVVYSADQSKR